jgi:hypothetical protein
VQQRIRLKRLRDEVARALFDQVDRILHRAVPGDDDRNDVGIAGARLLQHLPAINARQPQVRYDDVVRKF